MKNNIKRRFSSIFSSWKDNNVNFYRTADTSYGFLCPHLTGHKETPWKRHICLMFNLKNARSLHVLSIQWTPFTMTSVLLKFFHEHHLPRFNVDRNLNSGHCSQQRMKLPCTCSCNILIRCRFLAAQGITSFASNGMLL